jgi:hypothetical protein
MLTDVLAYRRTYQRVTQNDFDPPLPVKIWSKGVFDRLLPVERTNPDNFALSSLPSSGGSLQNSAEFGPDSGGLQRVCGIKYMVPILKVEKKTDKNNKTLTRRNNLNSDMAKLSFVFVVVMFFYAAVWAQTAGEAEAAAKAAKPAVREVAGTADTGSAAAVLNKAVLGNVASKNTADGIAEEADTTEAKIAERVAEVAAEAAKAAAAKAAEEARAFRTAADAALMREKEAQVNADNAMSAARVAKANEEAMAALQATMNTRATYMGYGSIALGCGTVIYGIIQNIGATSHVDKREFRQAEKAAKSRDAAYYFGAAALLSGITVIILF